MAIVSVLAALLFPVFSSARAAAYQTACASNFRQAGLAANLYFGDNNEGMIPAAYNGNNDANALNDRRWPQILGAYISDRRIFKCPSDSMPWPRPPAMFDPDLLGVDARAYDYSVAKLSNLGYNYLYLAPIIRVGNLQTSMPRSLGAISNVSQTIFGVDSVSDVTDSGRPVGGGNHLVVPPCRYQQIGPTQIDTFYYGQGIEVIVGSFAWEKTPANKFREYGGAWPWHNGRMNVLFVDGRVKPMAPTSLVKGCTLETAVTGVIMDTGGYEWDLQ